ncbi:MAG: hypothetical protein U5K37_02410 [Natrialbaceae archaeon]|nr:hypothetical protein [Natrialbaceae archaeon]
MTQQMEEVLVEMHGELSRATLHDMIDNLDAETQIHSFKLGIATDDPSRLGVGNGHEPPETNGSASTARLQLGGDPFVLMQVLAETDDWVQTAELRSAIPASVDVNAESIGGNLWSLAERGLIEKRRCEEDGRRREYRMTDRGQQVLADALDRADGGETIAALAD